MVVLNARRENYRPIKASLRLLYRSGNWFSGFPASQRFDVQRDAQRRHRVRIYLRNSSTARARARDICMNRVMWDDSPSLSVRVKIFRNNLSGNARRYLLRVLTLHARGLIFLIRRYNITKTDGTERAREKSASPHAASPVTCLDIFYASRRSASATDMHYLIT